MSTSRITAWRLDQVEGIEEHIGVMAPERSLASAATMSGKRSVRLILAPSMQ